MALEIEKIKNKYYTDSPSGTRGITRQTMLKIVRSPHVEENEFKMAFLMLALNDVLCPTTCHRLSSALLPALTVASNARQYDWCSFVLEHLLKAIEPFSKKFDKEGFVCGIGGCTFFLALFYLDRIKRAPVNWGLRPRTRAWSDEEISKAKKVDFSSTGDYGKRGWVDAVYGFNHPLVARDFVPVEDNEEVVSKVTSAVWNKLQERVGASGNAAADGGLGVLGSKKRRGATTPHNPYEWKCRKLGVEPYKSPAKGVSSVNVGPLSTEVLLAANAGAEQCADVTQVNVNFSGQRACIVNDPGVDQSPVVELDGANRPLNDLVVLTDVGVSMSKLLVDGSCNDVPDDIDISLGDLNFFLQSGMVEVNSRASIPVQCKFGRDTQQQPVAGCGVFSSGQNYQYGALHQVDWRVLNPGPYVPGRGRNLLVDAAEDSTLSSSLGDSRRGVSSISPLSDLELLLQFGSTPTDAEDSLVETVASSNLTKSYLLSWRPNPLDKNVPDLVRYAAMKFVSSETVMLRADGLSATLGQCSSVITLDRAIDRNYVRVAGHVYEKVWDQCYHGRSSRVMLDPEFGISVIKSVEGQVLDYDLKCRSSVRLSELDLGCLNMIFVPVLQGDRWWCAAVSISRKMIGVIDSMDPVGAHRIRRGPLMKLMKGLDELLSFVYPQWLGAICVSFAPFTIGISSLPGNLVHTGLEMLAVVKRVASRLSRRVNVESLHVEADWLLHEDLMSQFNEERDQVMELVKRNLLEQKLLNLSGNILHFQKRGTIQCKCFIIWERSMSDTMRQLGGSVM